MTATHSTTTDRPFCPPTTPPTWIRPRAFRITHVALRVTVEVEQQRISGTVEHTVEWLPHGDPQSVISLDCHDVSVEKVMVDNQVVTFAHGRDALEITIAERKACRVTIYFVSERPRKGMFFIRENKNLGHVPMAWTQGAMEDHSYWFPCFDNPNNLCTFRVEMRHAARYMAIANGDLVETKTAADGWVTTTFEQHKPHVLYLLNIAVGDFVAVSEVNVKIPLTHYVPRGHAEAALPMFRASQFAIDWLGDYIGVPYVWSRYGHVVVHGFMWGGMENTTLTTITDRGLMTAAIQQREDTHIDRLVIHELVHQWFGDLLTMKAWSDIWLNESFATYLEARGTAAWRASRHDGNEDDVLALELWQNKNAYLEEDGGRYRRALVTNQYVDAYELFDRVAYEKGSLVLHYLSTILGEERFRAAVKLYTTRHQHDLVETTDWRQAIEDATGEAMDWFFADWVYRAGHPTINASWHYDASRKHVIVDLEQQLPDDGMPYRLAVTLWIGIKNGAVRREIVTLHKLRDVVVFAVDAESPAWVVVDPSGVIPAVVEEKIGATEAIARLGDARLPACARARAAQFLGKQYPTTAIISALQAAISSAQPELVRLEVIAALGQLRDERARDVLISSTTTTSEARLRRALAGGLGHLVSDATTAQALEKWAHSESSELTIGEIIAARGQLEYPGATPFLRAYLKRDSFNQRIRCSALAGLAASNEAPAIDDILLLLNDDEQSDAVLSAAASAAGKIGAHHYLAKERIRAALEKRLRHPSMMVRASTTKALGALQDTAAQGAINDAMEREIFGNVKRIMRETLEKIGKLSATTTTAAQLTKRIETLEKDKERLEKRLEAMEKRLDSK
jgi:aminopeptidase N